MLVKEASILADAKVTIERPGLYTAATRGSISVKLPSGGRGSVEQGGGCSS